MAKLFAFEEMDVVEAEAGEMTPEQIQAPIDAAATTEEVGDIAEKAEAIDDAGEAADDLEEVHDVIATSIEEEGGLSPVAAEAIRIAVKSICGRVGASPTRLYSVYASENFASASSRAANSRMAMESVGEFLAGLWAKIKESIQSLWEKIKEFWNTHFAKTGRMTKELEAMQRRVAGLKKERPSGKTVLELSGGLANSFGAESEVNASTVGSVLDRHVSYSNKLNGVGPVFADVKKIAKKLEETSEVSAKQDAISELAEDITAKFSDLATAEHAELVGGKKVIVSAEAKTEDKEEFIVPDITIGQAELKEKVSFTVLAKNEMGTVLKKAMSVNDSTVGIKKAIEAASKEIKDTVAILDKVVKGQEKAASVSTEADDQAAKKDKGVAEEAKKQLKLTRATIRGFNKLNTKFGKLSTEVVSLNFRAIDSAVALVNVSLREYKA